MGKFLAVFVMVLALVYGDLDASSRLASTLLPLLFAVAFVYLFGIVRAASAFVSMAAFYHSNLVGDGAWESIGLPLIGLVAALYFLIRSFNAEHAGGAVGYIDLGGFGGDGGCDGGGDAGC